jgi:hypothetical protein
VALQKAQRAAFCLAQPCQAQRAASWLASLHAVGFSVGRMKFESEEKKWRRKQKVEEKTKSHLPPKKKHRETDLAFKQLNCFLQFFFAASGVQLANAGS